MAILLSTPIQCNDLLRNTQSYKEPHKQLCTDTGRRDTSRDQKNRNGDDAAKLRRENIQIGKHRGSNNTQVKPWCVWLCISRLRMDARHGLRTESDQDYSRREIPPLSTCLGEQA